MDRTAYAQEIGQLDLAAAVVPAPITNLPARADAKPKVVAPRRSNVKSDAGALLSAIMNAADSAQDIGRIVQLTELYQKIRADEAKRAYRAAFPAMQAELPVIDQNGRIVIQKDNKIIQSTPYAKWEDINEAIQPVLFKHGFGLFFEPGIASDGKITVTAVVTHVEGHEERATVTLSHDSSGSKNSVQAVGSTLSYGQRYSARALLNFQSRAKADQDDDGEAAGAPAGPAVISIKQRDELRALIDETASDVRRFCDHFKIPSVADLPADRFTQAVNMLKSKKRAS